jgi:hypothetical protein
MKRGSGLTVRVEEPKKGFILKIKKNVNSVSPGSPISYGLGLALASD